MARSRPKRVRNAQKTHVLIEKPLLEEIDKSGMSRAAFIRCGIKLYLEKTNPKNITSIGLRYKLGLKKTSEGMEMIFKQLTGVLEKAGLEEIKALGEDFDPNFHNAVMMEDNDQYDSGKVTEVMQKGYTLNSKVIRPSMVKVNN